MTKTELATIRVRRRPVYRALAALPPSNHWPRRPEPFAWADSEVGQFMRRLLPDATDRELQRMLGIAKQEFGVIRFDRETRLWSGTGDVSKMDAGE